MFLFSFFCSVSIVPMLYFPLSFLLYLHHIGLSKIFLFSFLFYRYIFYCTQQVFHYHHFKLVKQENLLQLKDWKIKWNIK